MSKVDEISAGAFFSGGKHFFEAAQRLMTQSEGIADPIYFLHSHALELILKAWLRAKGTSTATLASKQLGHNLVHLYDAACAADLKVEGGLYEAKNIMNMLHDSNEDQGLRYFTLKSQMLPELQWLSEFVGRLLTTLEHELAAIDPNHGKSGPAVKLNLVMSKPAENSTPQILPTKPPRK